jgi:Fic family protein
VVSGPLGREKIHYHAPSPEAVKEEMDRFLAWFNGETKMDPVIKVAIAHFWFIIIHPFDDGNGRIARALSDMLLSRSDEAPHRYYSMSSQLLIERKQYYDRLQQSQHGDGDITAWLDWFLTCLYRSIESSQEQILKVLHKSMFWDNHKETDFNARQRLMLNKLLDGIDGKLKSSKWAKMAKCSADTALRDIKDLIEKGILEQEASGGRSTNYTLVDF